jgi:hypothetical protein
VLRKLERILQQVSYRREKHVSVGIHCKFRVYVGDAEFARSRSLSATGWT